MKKYRDSGQGLVDYDALVGESSDDENSRLKREKKKRTLVVTTIG